MSSTLYRKYRPQRFADVLGQIHIVETLTNALKHGRVGQAYLFTGSRGTGKTTLARLLAAAINCSRRKNTEAEPCGTCPHCLAVVEGRALDVIEIDAASHTGVDNIRELRETIKLPPSLGSHKIYIIDEVHMLSQGAWNALLKTLEEPPTHAVFILATTALHKIPDTILSRCQRFDFSTLPLRHIIEKLTAIAKSEQITIEPEALEMIAMAAEGSMRDAESLLAQVMALEDKRITAREVATIMGITEQSTVVDFTRSLAERDLDAALALLNRLAETGYDFYIFSQSLLHYFRALMIASLDPKLINTLALPLTPERRADLETLGQRFTPQETVRLVELFQTARKEIRSSPLPQLPLEIATVKFLYPKDSSTNISGANQNNSLSKVMKPSPPEQSMNPNSTKIRMSQSPVKDTQVSPTPENQTTKPPKDQSPKISLGDIEMQWRAFLAAIKRQNAGLYLSLAAAYPKTIEGNTVTIGVRFPLHQEQLARAEHTLTLENTLATMVNAPLKLIFIVEEETVALPHPLLSDALNILGGKVVG